MQLPARNFGRSATFIACLLTTSIPARHAVAQAGLKESLERLDRDQDGRIAPDEITAQARPYLERIAESRRLSLDKSNEISEYQQAARIYHALKNGVAGREITLESTSSVKPFGTDENQPLVPEFGTAEVMYPYTRDDVDEANRTMRRYDRNRDGYIDRKEAEEAKWTHDDPFSMDLNADDRMSRMEFVQRYARRRLLSGAASELIKKSIRVGNGIPSTARPESRREENSWWRRRGDVTQWLSSSLIDRFDLNRDGRLEEQETKNIGMPVALIDLDRNGELSRDELQNYLAQQQKESAGEFEGLPGWFFELDADEDGQVAMAEFTTEWTEDKFAEFSQLDSNEDGLLTAAEVANSRLTMGGSFSNDRAEVLAPGRTIISEIEIAESIVIDDLNLQLSITHTSTGSLDAYLTGPGGQRVELFSGIGGSGDHFDKTVFDDDSSSPIVKAQPPFIGTFQTSALTKRQPSLSQFNGQNAKGIWELVIRGTRSDRYGMLHNWSLNIRPKETMLDSHPAAQSTDADSTASVQSSQ